MYMCLKWVWSFEFLNEIVLFLGEFKSYIKNKGEGNMIFIKCLCGL